MTENYDVLLEAWKKERHSKELQPLQESFYGVMTEYVSQLREQTRMLDKSSIKGRIAEKEKEYAEKMLKELAHLRLRKIVEAELDGSVLSGAVLTLEEKTFHADFRQLISSHEDRVKNILMGAISKVKVKPLPKTGLKVVRFQQAVPAIMGIDMKTYGPFKEEDVASIPIENAENLIRRGIAKEVEIQ